MPTASSGPTPAGSPGAVEPAITTDGQATHVWLGPLADDPYPGGSDSITSVRDVTWTGSGWVAVGWGQGGGVTWRSSDGQVWTPSGRPPVFDGVYLNAVAAAGGRVVAVGSDPSARTARAAAWYSDDGGATWRRAPDTRAMRMSGPGQPADAPGFSGIGMQSVAPLADGGFVAVGYLGCDSCRGGFAAWISSDGVEWRRLPGTAKASDGSGDDVQAFGNGWIAGGGALRRSAGETWTSDQARIEALAVGHGLIVRASRTADWWNDPPQTLSWSTNGTRWVAAKRSAVGGEVLDLAATADGFVAVGWTEEYGSALLWSSGDGRRWTTKSVPLLTADRLMWPGAAVASNGQTLVVVGNAVIADPASTSGRPFAVVLPAVASTPPTIAAPARPTWSQPAQLAWSGLSPAIEPTTIGGAELLDGRVLLVAGSNDSGQGASTAQILDPASGGVTAASPMPHAILRPVMARASDGRVWVFPTDVSMDDPRPVDGLVYDPAGDRWTALPPSFTIGGGFAASVSDVAWDHDGNLVVAAPALGPGGIATYDTTGRVVRRTSIDGGGLALSLSVTTGGTYALFGIRLWRWADPDARWEPISISPRMGGRILALGDGRLAVYAEDVIGPACDSAHLFTYVDVFDPGTGRWSSGVLPQARAGAVVLSTHDGRIAVIGGSRRTLNGCEWSGESGVSPSVLLAVPAA